MYKLFLRLRIKWAKVLAGTDYAVIPKKPNRKLLESMALRQNHAFNAPNDFGSDEEIERARKSDDFAITARLTLTSREKESALITMQQIHEEVVGNGFYKYGE